MSMSDEGLYVDQFTLAPVTFKRADPIVSNENWLLVFYLPQLKMSYKVYFGMSEQNDKLVNSLIPNVTRALVQGSIKENKAGDIILRARQIIKEEK